MKNVAARMGRQRLFDGLATISMWCSAGVVASFFFWLLADMAWRGAEHLSWTFLTETPDNAGRAGGIAPVLVSTGLILAVCLMAALPLGLATALWLAEFTRAGGRKGRWIRGSLDVLAGVPSIVFGLFGNAVFCVMLGMGFSILSGGLTLACMVLPIFIRLAEESLRAVPADYRLAAGALGLSRGTTLRRIVLPAALPGISAGLILGVGRALAETAALIFTSGSVDRFPQSVFDSGRSLSVHIYELAMHVPGAERPAAASAMVLVVLLAVINTGALFLMKRFFGPAGSPPPTVMRTSPRGTLR